MTDGDMQEWAGYNSSLSTIDDKEKEGPLEDSKDGRSPSTPQSRTQHNDVAKQVQLKHDDNIEQHQSSPDGRSKTIIAFVKDDHDNPYNWSPLRKAFIVVIGVITVLNSTLGSTLPSGDIPYLAKLYNVTHEQELVLPNSIYLVGYVLGPLLFGPLSEQYGRWIVMIGTFAGFTIFAAAIAVAPNWTAFVIFRLIQGTCASSPISVIGGLYADIYNNATSRGRSMAIFMAATSFGPLGGPIISGFLAPFNERWPFWFGLIFAGVSWIPLAFLPETYAPTILTRRARKMRKANPSLQVYAAFELEHDSFREICTVVLTRPIRMFFCEYIVLTSCLYLSLVYAIIYMFFQLYPLIFPKIYGFNLGEEGLAFLPIGVGSAFSCVLYLYWDHFLAQARKAEKKWVQREEYRRLPLACVGGPVFAIALFWIGWSARESVHWIVPILGALPFGFGFLLIFMALINYMVDAYETFAASAMAAASCSRSVFGAVMPFATRPMAQSLGVAWACSLLGFLSLLMCVIPFAFIKYGDQIRANSEFCQQLLAEKRRLEQGENETGAGTHGEGEPKNVSYEV